jgi:hypothetical protein
MEHDLEKAHNTKLILAAFKHLSRMKNNFHKSEFFILVRLKTWLANMLTCSGPVSD